MLSAILVLLGIAVAIWYFARKQAQSIVTLTQEDVIINNGSVSTDESASTPPEVAAEKAFIQAQQDALAEAQAKAAAEVKSSTVETPAVEAKPKKKRRYYPKKK
jgi:hypothetical protein